MLILIGIVFVLVTTLILVVQYQAQASIETIQNAHAQNILKAVTTTIETEYHSIRFHQERILLERKEELRSIVSVAWTVLDEYYNQWQSRILSEKQAQHAAQEAIAKMRYANGIGYLWITDTQRPFPRMIMHPTIPSLNGTILNNPQFNTALGKQLNLFQAANDICEQQESGYVDYLWPKPGNEDSSLLESKLSYVQLFKPWNWIIGSGLYINDIEESTNERVIAVVDELRQAFQKIQVGANGYMFLFAGKNEMLIHPNLEGQDISVVRNPSTGKIFPDEIKQTIEQGKHYLDYTWPTTVGSTTQLLQKRMYISYFEPLDWYLCISYYVDEIRQPVTELRHKIQVIAIFFIVLAFSLAAILARSITAPLKKLALAAEGIHKQELTVADIPIGGSQETQELGKSLATTLNALLEKEENLRITLNSISDGVIATNINGCITDMNPIAEKLTGWKRTETQNRKLEDVFHIVDTSSHKPLGDLVKSVLEKRKVIEFTDQPLLLSRNNKQYKIALSASPIQNKTGSSVGIVLIFRDITEKIRTEEQLHQTRKMDAIGQLAGGVAHDFNNMLSGILGAAQLLKNQNQQILDTKSQEYIDIILRASTRAADLTAKLLAFGRKGKLISTEINAHDVLDETIAILKRTIDRQIEITETKGANDSTVVGDASQLQNAFMNIGINASHAMPNGGNLQIETRNVHLSKAYCEASSFALYPGEHIEIEIRDTGCGIPIENIPKIFEPFFTTKEQGKGTGLGLAAVYGIVQDHHGAINVYSEVDVGTSFHIFLPCSEKNPMPVMDNTEIVGGTGTILLVDDEDIIRITGKYMLEAMGYQVILANNGQEALAIFQQNPSLDLVIMDMIMPVMNGREAFIKMKNINPECPIVISSGFAKDERLDELKQKGLAGFIRKPYRDYELSQLLANILQNRKK